MCENKIQHTMLNFKWDQQELILLDACDYGFNIQRKIAKQKQ